MEEPMYLPSLSHFNNGNGWIGSQKGLRFAIEPPKDGELSVSIWSGPLCRELSELRDTKTFPVSEEGRRAAMDWLMDQAQAL